MKKQTTEKRDEELRQVMAEEGSRGRKQPIRAYTLEEERRARVIAKRVRDPNCDKREYAALIRHDFGLSDDSPAFHHYMKIWDQYRGR